MTYATDGKCHNSEPGTFGHECGKPAEFIGTKPSGFRSGFCRDCKENGFEASQFDKWDYIGRVGYVDLQTGRLSDPFCTGQI